MKEEIDSDECPKCGSLEVEATDKGWFEKCICSECLYEWVVTFNNRG